MTITTQTEGAPPEWHSWTRRTWLLVWTSAAIVVLLAAGLIVNAKLHALDDEYGPISTGSFGGRGAPGIRFDSDGFGDARLMTTGDRTTHVYQSLSNDGSHSVRITGVDLDDVTVEARWAPVPTADGATIPDSKARWRAFPAVVGARTELQLRYTIRRPPHCQDEKMIPGQGEYYDDAHVVHWESLLGDHATAVNGLLSPRYDSGIQIC